MMLLKSLTGLFKPKDSISEPHTCPQAASRVQGLGLEPEEIINQLMESYKRFRDFCRKERIETAAQRSWKVTGNQRITANNMGLQIVRDEAGNIVKTRDAMRRVKEFRHNQTDGSLEINKYGVWSKLDCGRLTETGTLIWRQNGTETYEFLDGTVLTISFSKMSLIAHNEMSGEQVAISKDGTVRHSFKRDSANHFRSLKDGIFESWTESYDEPVNSECKTISGTLYLESITRIERVYEDGNIQSEKFYFGSKQGTKSIAVSLKSPPGVLHLSKVHCLENRYQNGKLSESIFQLQEPVSVSKDVDGKQSILHGIKQVRSFQMRDGVCSIVYIDSNGDENLFFPQL